MAYDYDALYANQPEALGEPTPVIAQFFENLAGGPFRVLDLGCGQGRDALFIAGLGHLVVGVDLSANGVNAMRAAAAERGLKIEGVVADVRNYRASTEFDILLFDRVLHMLTQQERLATIMRLIDCVTRPGWIVIADEKRNIPHLKDAICASNRDVSIISEKTGYLFVRLD